MFLLGAAAIASISSVMVSTIGTTSPVPWMSINPGILDSIKGMSACHHTSHECREGVVIAKLNLGGADRIVFVDDGHGTIR